jgi:acyl carrier protein
MSVLEDMRLRAKQRQDLCRQVSEMIVSRLDLPIDVDWITDDQPLFGRGMELDSIDAAEIVIGLNSMFGVTIFDDDRGAFGSVAKLAERISEQR